LEIDKQQKRQWKSPVATGNGNSKQNRNKKPELYQLRSVLGGGFIIKSKQLRFLFYTIPYHPISRHLASTIYHFPLTTKPKIQF